MNTEQNTSPEPGRRPFGFWLKVVDRRISAEMEALFAADGITRTLGVWNRDYGQFDAQVAYQFSDKLGVTLEALNITEEDQSQYLQFENLPFAFDSGSRRILFGIRGSF